MSNKKNNSKAGSPRSAARLAAVQALYQLAAGENDKAEQVATEFVAHRLGAEVDGDQFVEADEPLFSDILKGSWERRDELDEMVKPFLTANWALDRIEPIIHAIFRAGSYELIARPDIPTAVVINEYVDVAHAFYDQSEASFVNGVLDKVAKSART